MRNDTEHNAPPKLSGMILGLIVLAIALSFIPLALIARARVIKTERQPIHLFLDMDFQPRYGPQDSQAGDLPARFADGRAMRPPVPGTVTFDSADAQFPLDDDFFYRGYETDGNLQPVLEQVESQGGTVEQPRYYEGFPPGLMDTPEQALKFVERGRERFNIYCGVCHGAAGYGDGPVQRQVMRRQDLTAGAIVGWALPANLHSERLLQMSTGQIYDTITRGRFSVDDAGRKTYTMWPYAAQVPPRDRWAIVAYVKALQLSQYFPVDQAPQEIVEAIEQAPVARHPALAQQQGEAGQTQAEPGPIEMSEENLRDPQLIAQGKALFNDPTKNCFQCHQADPAQLAVLGLALNAPAFMGPFWGAEREVHPGLGPDGQPRPDTEMVVFDLDYFVESVRNPQAKILKGTTPAMIVPVPPTDEELKALAAYVHSLSQ